jgi:hypothetical protein
MEVVFSGITSHELGALGLFRVRNEGRRSVRLWPGCAIQVGTGTNDLRPLCAGLPLDIQPGGVEVMTVQVPTAGVAWRFGVAVSRDGPRLWFADWRDGDVGWRVESWVADGLRMPPAATVWSGWVEP